MSQLEVIHEIIEASTEHQNLTITCVDCGEEFTWTAGEQVFFHDKGLKNEPKRCKVSKQPCLFIRRRADRYTVAHVS